MIGQQPHNAHQGECMSISRLLVILLTVLAPLSVSCVSESTTNAPLPTVKFTVIASGEYTISGLPENRKIEVFTSQTSPYEFIEIESINELLFEERVEVESCI